MSQKASKHGEFWEGYTCSRVLRIKYITINILNVFHIVSIFLPPIDF